MRFASFRKITSIANSFDKTIMTYRLLASWANFLCLLSTKITFPSNYGWISYLWRSEYRSNQFQLCLGSFQHLVLLTEFVVIISFFQFSFNLTIEVAFFEFFAVVVDFFAAGEGNFQFGFALFDVECKWN